MDFGIHVGFNGMAQYMGQLSTFERASLAATTKVDKATKALSKSWQDFANQIPGLTRIVEFARNPFTMLAAAIAGVTLAMVTGIGSAAAFNNEFLQLQNLNVDKSAEQIDNLRQTALKTALDTGKSAIQISRAFFDIQSGTGLFGEDVVAVTKNIADFSTATNTEFNVAVAGTVKAMRAFKLSASEIPALMASNFATVQLGITTFDQLAEVQTEFASSAAGASQTVDTANKIYAAFTATSKDTNIAANLTKTAFQDIGKKQTVDGLKTIGVQVFDMNGDMRDTTAIITDLVPKFQSMGDEDFAKLLEAMGGSEGLRGLMIQVRNEGKNVLKVFDDFDKAKESFDLNKLLENAKGDFKTLKEIVGNQLNTVMIQLGQVILPTVARLLKGVSDILPGIVDSFDRWGFMVKGVIITMTALGGVVLLVKGYMVALTAATAAYNAIQLGVVRIIAMARSAIITLQAAYIALTGGINGTIGVFRSLSIIMRANPIGVAITAVAVLSAGIGLLVSRTKESNTQSQRLAAISKEVADRVGQESGQVNRLFAALKDENTGKAEKHKLVGMLLSQYGKYLGDLANEKDLLNNIEEAQKRVNNAIEQKVIAQIKAEKQEDLFSQRTTARLQALNEVAALRNKLPVSQDALSDILSARVAALEKLRSGAAGANEEMKRLENEMVQTFKNAQSNAGLNISYSDATAVIRKAATEIADIDEKIRQIDADFNALGTTVTSTTKTVGENGDGFDGFSEDIDYVSGSLEELEKQLGKLQERFEKQTVAGSDEWKQAAKDIEAVEMRIELLKLSLEEGQAIRKRFFAVDEGDLENELKALEARRDKVDRYTQEWFDLGTAIDAAQAKIKAFQEADAVVLGEAVNIPQRNPADFLPAAKDGVKGLGDEISYLDRQLIGLQERFSEMGSQIRDTLINAIGESFFELGKAIGEGMEFSDAFSKALLGLANVVLSEVPKYIGMFLLQTAVGLGFPAGTPFALAGIGLLAFSGVAAGLLNSMGKDTETGNVAGQATAGFGQQAQAQAASGLGSFNAGAMDNGRQTIKVYIGNKEVTALVRKDIINELELQGG